MKATLTEHSGCYVIQLTAETIEEAVRLVRMGMDHTKDLRGIYVNAYDEGSVTGSMVIGKRKDANSTITRRGGP